MAKCRRIQRSQRNRGNQRTRSPHRGFALDDRARHFHHQRRRTGDHQPNRAIAGVYYKSETDKNGRRSYNASLIPNRGAWLKFETDKNDLVWVRIDKTRKLSAQVLLKALGLTDGEIYDSLRHPEYFQKTIEKEGQFGEEEALMELYRKLRPGEPPTVAGGEQLLHSRFFDPKRYDLGRVGRYKLNKKLRLTVPDTTRVLTSQDILTAIDYLINLEFDIGSTDDIDHLGNRRVRSVGELL